MLPSYFKSVHSTESETPIVPSELLFDASFKLSTRLPLAPGVLMLFRAAKHQHYFSVTLPPRTHYQKKSLHRLPWSTEKEKIFNEETHLLVSWLCLFKPQISQFVLFSFLSFFPRCGLSTHSHIHTHSCTLSTHTQAYTLSHCHTVSLSLPHTHSVFLTYTHSVFLSHSRNVFILLSLRISDRSSDSSCV